MLCVFAILGQYVFETTLSFHFQEYVEMTSLKKKLTEKINKIKTLVVKSRNLSKCFSDKWDTCTAFLPCDAMHSAAIAVTRCPSVRPSVTFVSCTKTNKDIFEIFSPSGSHTILVFQYQTGWRCFDGIPLTEASNARGYEKMTIFDQYLALSDKRL